MHPLFRIWFSEKALNNPCNTLKNKQDDKNSGLPTQISYCYMANLTLEIKNIKNIKHCVLDIPFEKGVYAITGTNGSGKSTIINCLGKLVVDYSVYSLSHINTEIVPEFSFTYKDRKDTFQLRTTETLRKNKHGVLIKPKKSNKWILDKEIQSVRFDGLFEGSFFFGKRFKDSAIIDNLLEHNKNSLPSFIPLTPFVGENVSLILHNDINHYKDLTHLGLAKAKNWKLKNDPCFINYDGNIVSQYAMSSGECLLISLFAFINTTLREEMNTPELEEDPTLLIIDEIEAALHPSAIKRLLEYLHKLSTDYNFVIIISSHSAEVIRQISPRNLFNIEQDFDGEILISNPCYPSYAIRDVYTHMGYDIVILTEDVLAQKFVNSTITELRLSDNRLVNILPVGGWENVLKLHNDLINNGYFGPSTQVFCVLDGDVENMPEYKKYRKNSTPKLFLPIPSVEKLLQKIPNDSIYNKLKAKLDSYIFKTSTIEQLYKEFYNGEPGHSVDNDKDGKNFYNHMIATLAKRGISEDHFISSLSTFVKETVDTSRFIESLRERFSI